MKTTVYTELNTPPVFQLISENKGMHCKKCRSQPAKSYMAANQLINQWQNMSYKYLRFIIY